MRTKMKMKGGADEKPTKLDVIKENPVIAKALVDFAAEKGISGSGMKQKGSGWWSDFVDWMKRNKVISSGTKIAGYIATALGQPAIGTALGAASTAAGAFGYGRGYVNQLSQVGTGEVFGRTGLIQNQKTTRMKGGARYTSAAVPTTTTYNSVFSAKSGKKM